MTLSRIVRFCIVILPVWVIGANSYAGKNPQTEIPILDTPAAKLQYFLWIKNHVPKLFSDAAKYDIDLLELLDDEIRLLKELDSQEYHDAFKDNPEQYLKIKSKPSTGGSTHSSIQIRPEAITNWKKGLKTTLELIEHKYPDSKSTNPKQAIVQALLDTQNDVNDGERVQKIFNFFVSKIKDISLKSQIFSNQDWTIKIANLESALSDMNESFEGKTFNLKEQQVTKADLFKIIKVDLPKLIDKKVLEKKQLDLITLWASLMGGHPLQFHGNLSEQQAAIDRLDALDLTTLQDKKDGLIPRVQALMDSHQKALTEAKLPKQWAFKTNTLSDRLYEKLATYFNDQEKVEVKLDKNASLHLMEMPAGISIFRGCTGQDCSTQRSFSYPNHPGEQVYFIVKKKNKKKELKGYVSTRRVDIEESPGEAKKRGLYVHTIAGPNLTSSETEQILNTFEKSKEALGVKHIVLPQSSMVNTLNNFAPISQIYKNVIQDKTEKPMTFVHPEISKKIESFKSNYNDGDYDHQVHHPRGVIYEPKIGDLDKLDHQVKEVVLLENGLKDILDQKTTANDVVEFCLDLHESGRNNQIPQFLSIANIDLSLWEQFISIYENSKNKPVKSYLEKMSSITKKLGVTSALLEKRPDLLSYGILQSSDAFHEENRNTTLKNMKILIEKGLHLEKVNEAIKQNLDVTLAENSPVRKACNKLVYKGDSYLEDLGEVLKGTGRLGSLDLIDRLNDTVQEDVDAAADAIITIQDYSPEVQKRLGEIIAKGDLVQNKAMEKVVQHYLDTIPQFMDFLAEPTEVVLKELGNEAKKLEFLQFISKNYSYRSRRLESKIEKVITLGMDDSSKQVRFMTCAALSSMVSNAFENKRSVAPEIYRAFARAIGDRPDRVGDLENIAALAVKTFTEYYRPMVPDLELQAILVNLLKDEKTRMTASSLLHHVSPLHPKTLTMIVDLLKDENARTRYFALNALITTRSSKGKEIRECTDNHMDKPFSEEKIKTILNIINELPETK
jgi:hypothetical protein